MLTFLLILLKFYYEKQKQSCHKLSQLIFNRFPILQLKIRSKSTFLPQNAKIVRINRIKLTLLLDTKEKKAYHLNDLSCIFSWE